MDIFLIVLGFILIIIGIIGCIIPGLPGPFSAWAGLLAVNYAKVIPDNWTMIFLTFVVALAISLLDYFIPAIGTKKFGGSKYGIYGATLGLLFGIFFPIPGGIILGTFLGAFVGEYLRNKDSERALKAAVGAFIGFLASTGMQLIITFVFGYMYISIVIENWHKIVKLIF